MTGCLSRFQGRRHQHHRESEQKEQLRREVQDVFGRARMQFLTTLLVEPSASHEGRTTTSSVPGPANSGVPPSGGRTQQGASLRDLERQLDERMPLPTQGSSANIASRRSQGGRGGDYAASHPRLQLACAYLAVSAKGVLPSAAAAQLDADGDSSSDDEGEDADEPPTLSDPSAGNQVGSHTLHGRKMQDVKVQMCLQWVVARELNALSHWLGGSS